MWKLKWNQKNFFLVLLSLSVAVSLENIFYTCLGFCFSCFGYVPIVNNCKIHWIKRTAPDIMYIWNPCHTIIKSEDHLCTYVNLALISCPLTCFGWSSFSVSFLPMAHSELIWPFFTMCRRYKNYNIFALECLLSKCQ